LEFSIITPSPRAAEKDKGIAFMQTGLGQVIDQKRRIGPRGGKRS